MTIRESPWSRFHRVTASGVSSWGMTPPLPHGMRICDVVARDDSLAKLSSHVSKSNPAR